MKWCKRILASLLTVLAAASAVPAAAQTTILFCASVDTVVRVEFSLGQREVLLNDLPLPAAPGREPAVPGPFVTRVGATVIDYELLAEGDRWRLRTTQIRLPTGTLSATIGECRIISAADVVPRQAFAPAANAAVHTVTIPDGLTSQQVANLLLSDINLTGEIVEVPREGTLLPGTYHFYRGEARSHLLDRMARAFDSAVADVWARRAADLPIRTPEELVILASIVEKETGIADERSRVASVFINRLNRGMRLQSDPTIIYGIYGGAGRPVGQPILQSQIDQRTPYNTYQIEGLPPGPIANPGMASLEAVANPSRTNDVFFVADGTGGHVFAETLEEHNRNVARWRQLEQQRREAAEAAATAAAPGLAPATFTAVQATAGAEAYAANCAGCHGPDLLTGFAPPLAGDGFAHWLPGPVSALWDKIYTTMPMGNPGGLDAETYANIVAFILQQNGFEPGIGRLPADSAMLATMGFIEGAAPPAGNGTTAAEAPAITLAFEDVGNPTLLAAIANGDAAAGEQVAMQCAGCHSLGEGGPNMFGPNLYGVVYRGVGTHEGFNYSPALAALGTQGAIWTYAGLDAFLASPQAATPGTTMPFGGIADATDRANLIAYLRTLAAEPAPVAFVAP